MKHFARFSTTVQEHLMSVNCTQASKNASFSKTNPWLTLETSRQDSVKHSNSIGMLEWISGARTNCFDIQGRGKERKWQLIFPFAKWFFIEIGKERSLWQGYHQPNWAEMAVLEVYFVVMQNSVPWSLWSIGHILQRKNFFLPFLKIFLKKFFFFFLQDFISATCVT